VPIFPSSGFGGRASGTCGGPLLATCPNCRSDLAGFDGERCPSCSLPLKVACPSCGEHAWADEEECPACDTPLSFAVDA
jgi:predicted amidophosphoribosyltransferase